MALRRARDQAVTLLADRASTAGASDEALPLIDAACTLLASGASRAELAVKHLLGRASDALASTAERSLVELAAQLAAVAEAV